MSRRPSRVAVGGVWGGGRSDREAIVAAPTPSSFIHWRTYRYILIVKKADQPEKATNAKQLVPYRVTLLCAESRSEIRPYITRYHTAVPVSSSQIPNCYSQYQYEYAHRINSDLVCT